jgi:transcription initiation factor TFIID TATA-box-binding protein
MIYEPEQFPGGIYRLKGSSVAVLVFVSGKMVIAGAKSKNDISTAAALMEQFDRE